MKKIAALLLACLVALCFLGCDRLPVYSEFVTEVAQYENSAYIVLNNNQPEFSQEDITASSYEYYSELDRYGRCGYVMACIGQDLMPTEDRKSISHIKPSGWVNNPYDFVDGEYLYNRCHLIGFQLTGENDNERNLITGTRYMNTEGMLPFENMVADYVKDTDNHVMYRVTPVFDGSNLVARGVQMEALSVEDDGAGICFNVYCYNIQPGVEIDYATGDNWVSQEYPLNKSTSDTRFILNTNSKKFHTMTCAQAESINEKNKEEFIGDRQQLLDQGYTPAGCCDP